MVKDKDLVILSHLRKNGRETLTKMSKKTGIPISTIYDRMKFHDGDLIKKHTCIVDFNKIGYNTKAYVLLKVHKDSRKEVAEYLRENMNVNSVSKVNNDYDYLVEVICRHLKGIEKFIESMEEKFNLTAQKVFYEIENIKREGFMEDPELLEVLF